MIDTHCHILWGVDDASKTMEESMDMLKVAVADGIDTIVASSHVKPPLFDNSKEKMLQALDILYVEIAKANLPITVIFGGENFISHHTIHKLENDEFITYNNNGKYILLEFSWTKNVYDHPTAYIKQFIDKGFIPVIAHPERYEWVHEDYSLLKRWREMGALLQVNRTSIFGLDRIPAANETALRMLEDDLVDTIASDAHRCYAPRLPKLSDVYHFVSEKYGEDRAKRYLIEVPNKIIYG